MSLSPECPQLRELREYAAGSLEEARRVELWAHITKCPDCQRSLAREGTVKAPAVPGEVGWTVTGMDQPTGPDPTITRERTPSSGRHRPESETSLSVEALVAEDDTEEQADLSFLEPTTVRGAIGRIGPYEIWEIIGRGGMGIVLKAFDPSLHRVVAIKVLAPRLASTQRPRRRFLREARSAAAINHPNVVTIHAVSEQKGMPYLVMECIAGLSLRERIRGGPRLQPVEILRIALQVAEGLGAAHEQGLIHRDVKPANIMLENGVERVKITDFGLALAAMTTSDLTSDDQIVGTPAFMSPEQVRGRHLDPRSDLFSLGTVMYAMVTDHSPFRGAHTLDVVQRVCELVPPSLREVDSSIPESLSRIVDRLMEKNPDARYATAAQVAEVLKAAIAEINAANQASAESFLVPGAPRSTPDLSAGGGREWRHRWTWVGAVLLAGVLMLGAILARSHQQPSFASLPHPVPFAALASSGPVLTVAHSSPASYSSLPDALAAVEQPGTTIQVREPGIYEGAITVKESSMLRGLTIEATVDGVVLKADPPSASVVQLRDTSGVILRRLEIHSRGDQWGLTIFGPNEGATIDRVRFLKPDLSEGEPSYAQAWVCYQARGDRERPIRFRECTFGNASVELFVGGKGTGTVSHVAVERCRFEGDPPSALSGGSERHYCKLKLVGPARSIRIIDNLFLGGEDGVNLDGLANGSGPVEILANRFYQTTHWIALSHSSAAAEGIEIAGDVIVESGAIDTDEGHLAGLQRQGWRIHDNLWETAQEPTSTLATPRRELELRSRDRSNPDFLRPVRDPLQVRAVPAAGSAPAATER
jgi:serine/threonine protein kinase